MMVSVPDRGYHYRRGRVVVVVVNREMVDDGLLCVDREQEGAGHRGLDLRELWRGGLGRGRLG